MNTSQLFANADPSGQVGNRKTRHIRQVIAAAAATLALTSCATHDGQKVSADKATTSTAAPELATTTSPEQNPEVLRAKTQASAENFAARIMDEYNKKKTIYSDMQQQEDGSYTVSVQYDVPSRIGGHHGEHGLIASMRQNAQGTLNPSTVDWISIYENNVAGEAITASKATLYSLDLKKNKSTGDWSIRVGDEIKGGPLPITAYNTRVPNGEDGICDPLNMELLDARIKQAATMIDRAVAQEPVDYPPPVDYAIAGSANTTSQG